EQAVDAVNGRPDPHITGAGRGSEPGSDYQQERRDHQQQQGKPDVEDEGHHDGTDDGDGNRVDLAQGQVNKVRDLLHVVHRARDERGGGVLLPRLWRPVNDCLEDCVAKVPRDACGDPGQDVYVREHAQQVHHRGGNHETTALQNHAGVVSHDARVYEVLHETRYGEL